MIDWINNPMLQNMDPLKIELIKTVDSDLLNRVNDSVKSKKVLK